MIKETKHYSEDFAKNLFNRGLKADVISDCHAYGFEPDFSDLNSIVLAQFDYKGNSYSVFMDAINAEIKLQDNANSERSFTNNFAGLTDNFFFALGDDGIVDEWDYAYVFCEIYNHLIYGLPIWVSDLIEVVSFTIPWDQLDIKNKYVEVV